MSEPLADLVGSPKENIVPEANDFREDQVSLSNEHKEEVFDADTGSESSVEDEDPPMLSYSRITKTPRSLFERDGVSAAYSGNGIIAFGTHSGILHVASSSWHPIRTSRIHRASILQITSQSGFIASASLDGTVVISSIDGQSETSYNNYNRPIYSLSLDQNYESTRAFCCGGTAGTLLLNQKGWLKSKSATTLFQSATTIRAILWAGTVIAFCDEENAYLFDSISNTVLLKHSLRHDRSVALRHKAHMQLFGNYVLVACGKSLAGLDLTSMTVGFRYTADKTICGAVALTDTQILLLCLESGLEAELQILQYTKATDLAAASLDSIYADEVMLDGHESASVNDYILTGSRSNFLVVSGHGGICVSLTTLQEQLNWLLERGRLEEVIKLAEEHSAADELKNASGLLFEKLVSNKNWQAAADLARSNFGNSDIDFWISACTAFLKGGQEPLLLPIIPDDLKPLYEVYEKLFLWSIENALENLRPLYEKWPTEAINTGKIRSRLGQKDNKDSLLILANLYTGMEEYSEALDVYVKANSALAFKFASDHSLLYDNLDRLVDLVSSGLTFEDEKSEDALVCRQRIVDVANMKAELPVMLVISKLHQAENSIFLYWYLRELARADVYLLRPFVDLVIQVYAKHKSAGLLPMLNSDANYDVDKAAEICVANGLYNELVSLSIRKGDFENAMQILIEDLDSPDRAITLATERDDDKLQRKLIELSRDKPEFILKLLGSPKVSSTLVLNAVSKDTVIEGLREALNTIFIEQQKLLSYDQSILKVIRKESESHVTKLRTLEDQGALLKPSQVGDEIPCLFQDGELVPIQSHGDCPEYDGDDASWVSRKIQHLTSLLGFV